MPPRDDAERAAESLSDRFRRQWDRLTGAFRDVSTLFCAGGRKPTPAAIRWLERLANDNFVNGTAFHEDAREHARREGRRELALEIIASVRLDPMRLERLAEQMREIEE